MEFCVFDLEATGGNHEVDKIIEIGLVKVVGLEIVEEKDFLIRPEMKIPIFVQKLTSINQQDVEDAPTIEEVIDEILEFMGDSVLVAHNTSFDIPFFNSVLTRLGRSPLKNKSVCTNLMTKYMIPSLMNSNLHYMCDIFHIDHHNAHRALEDAKACSHLLLRYLNVFIDKDIKKINHLYYPRNRYELDQAHYERDDSTPDDIEEKIRSIRSPFLITAKGEEGVILFALPCFSVQEEIEFCKKWLEAMDWKTITIKLYGTLLESFIQFSFFYDSFEKKVQDAVMLFLWKRHFNTKEKRAVSMKDIPHFVLTNHLVPGQMIIYPAKYLFSKRELIFRYPGHNKRLVKYISSARFRRRTGESAEGEKRDRPKKFVYHYLNSAQSTPGQLFFADRRNVMRRTAGFFKVLDRFLAKNPNPYNYPENYI